MTMNEFESSFRIDATLVAEILVFVAVVVIMAKVVLPPLRRAMADRRAEIDRSLSATADAEARLEAAEAEYERHIRDARRQARKILTAYETMGRQVLADAKLRADRDPSPRVRLETDSEFWAPLREVDRQARQTTGS